MAISLIREKKRVKAEDTQIYREGVLGQLSGGHWSLQEGLGRRDEGGKGKSRSLKEKAELKSGWVVDYDKEGSVLRIRGKNILENDHVKIGAFHTLEIELHRPFVLRKKRSDTLSSTEIWSLRY
ncbi:unnamed protein product [Ilex paraguariensis]|uniref:Pelota N-terminal domain-containing protein n=1 Tax=Ilex paraguariensis TaxID=185542 RepID=A0ABC8TXR4_9AQUA